MCCPASAPPAVTGSTRATPLPRGSGWRMCMIVIAVDWSYAGIAAVGSELAPMVAASVCLDDAESEQLPDLDRVAFDGYVAGLRAAGWEGDGASRQAMGGSPASGGFDVGVPRGE